MMSQYYHDDLSLSEIGENFGITRQGARDAIKHGETTLLELEQKVGFAARYKAVQESLGRIEELARDIRFRNSNNYAVSEQIERDAAAILEILHRVAGQE